MRPSDPVPLTLVRPRFRLVDPDEPLPRDRSDGGVESFVELARMLLPVSSLSAQRSALVRQDLRLLVQEGRRDPARTAVCQALMASVVEELAAGVSSFSLRSLQARAQLPAEPEPA